MGTAPKRLRVRGRRADSRKRPSAQAVLHQLLKARANGADVSTWEVLRLTPTSIELRQVQESDTQVRDAQDCRRCQELGDTRRVTKQGPVGEYSHRLFDYPTIRILMGGA